MNVRHLRDLYLQVSKALDLPDPAALADYGHTEIGGVPTQIFHDAAAQPDRLCVHFDIGPMSEANRQQAALNLLRMNFITGTKTTGVYALEPLGWRAKFIVHLFGPETMEPAVLAQALRRLAAQASDARAVLHECAHATAAPLRETV